MTFEEQDPDPAEVERVLREAREWCLARGIAHAAMRRGLRTARAEMESSKVFVNADHVVHKRDCEVTGTWPAMVHLSIRRKDREPIRDWRELQQIKNAIMGPEHEAVELFPAEGRLMDTANQFHLWVLKEPGLRFPFGYVNRWVTDESIGRSRNRPLSKEVE